MSSSAPSVSDLELKYPFAPRSRLIFESMPLDEGLANKEVVGQAESRLLSALGRAQYESHFSGLVEFTSFFAAALVASQDPVLASRFSKKEAERAKAFYVTEPSKEKMLIIFECFGARFSEQDEGVGHLDYMTPFEDYLSLLSKYELGRIQKWKLTRQGLKQGIVQMNDNQLNDLFGDCAQKAIAEGVKNLRRSTFPRQLIGTKASVLRYVPAQRPRTKRGYEYVEEVLTRPVSDGRHRLVWLVLAPYLVNVKKVDDDEAIETIRAFVSVAGETRDLKRFVEYNVRRARRNGLLPPTLTTLKTEHPDLYWLLPKEVHLSESVPREKGAKREPS